MYYWTNRSEYSFSLNSIYACANISKQGFYKWRTKKNYVIEEEQFIVSIIIQIRANHPTMCCRAMYYKINPVSMGRDKFLSLCSAYGFKVDRGRRGKRTTNSNGVIRFDNLREGLSLVRIDQLWSSDITYFELDNIFYYITFVMDEYSRRIIGHQVSTRLTTEHTTLPALKKAIRTRKGKIDKGIIFHSDGGGQYYSHVFTDLTKKYGFKNSMCEYSYENPKSERINGVIKNNYLIHYHIKDFADLLKKVDLAVRMYNTDKPHTSLGRMTPVEFEKKLTLESC